MRSILTHDGSLASVYADAGEYVRTFQVLSVMEVFHALFRLTRSPMSAALMQWAGRTHVLIAVTHATPALQSTPAAGVLILAWAITEVIRYPSYAMGARCPPWLNYLRYTVFIPLYPLGAGAEMKLMYDSLPSFAKSEAYSVAMPNRWNFGFDYPTFLKVLLCVYQLLFYQLYAYMFVQRKKKLAGEKAKSA